MHSGLPAETKYRKDIDGLRAIAVLSVFLYHLQPQLLPGGFLGVDVFFVISGYLITSIIVREHHHRCFSFSRFYSRRIKRIFPALFVVVVLSACAAIVSMTPETYVNFMKSGRYAAAQLSNFYFSQKIDYFSEGFSGQPLLHTWSLGVEEQFYLFWPLLIYICFRCFQNKANLQQSNPREDAITGQLSDIQENIETYSGGSHITYSIAVIFLLLALASFFICNQLTETNYNLAFYMFYARAFEFCIGGGLALKILPVIESEKVNILCGITGLILLCFSFLFVSEEFLGGSFLQFGVVLPCIGSALIIHAHSRKSLANRLISNNFSVFVGKISYSLYLYHWPVIIFWKLCSSNRMLGWLESVAIILISFVLATLSYKLVEQPTRKSALSTWRTISSAAIVIIVFASSFKVIENFDKSEWRIAPYQIDKSVQAYEQVVGCHKFSEDGLQFLQCQEANREDTPVVALLGDSHAPHFLQSVASWAKKNGYNVKYNAVAGCPMVLGDFSLHQTIFDQQYSKFCEQSLSLLKRNIIDDPLVEIVMIAQRYDLFYDGIGYLSNTRIMTFKDREGRVVEDHISYYKDRLSETVNSMEEEGKKVIILNQVPININVDSCSWEPLLFKFFNRNSHCEYDYGFISKKQQPSIDFVKKFCQEHELTMFDPAQAMAEPQLNGKNLYRDGDHLSEYGVYNLVPYFERYMDQIMESEL